MAKKIEFYTHNLDDQDKKEVIKVLNSIILTTGKTVDEFEKKLAKFTGNKYAVAVSSCTQALFLSLKHYDIKKGDEVITTPMSYVATANVIEEAGAKPIFVDVDKKTGNLDITKIQSAITKKTKAIMPVHLYGEMVDMKALKKIAKKYKLRVIEDSAHCLEGKRDNYRPGNLSDMACFSFYATKNITSGEGGAIVCNQKAAYDWLRQARNHGINRSMLSQYNKKYQHYDMKFLGYKCNMDNIHAALLINQIDRVKTLAKKRLKIAQQYDKGFKDNNFIKTIKPSPNVTHARHVYTILVNPKKRNTYLHKFQNAGIGVGINYRPIHLMEYYKKKYGYQKGSFPQAGKIGQSTITLPFYPKLTQSEITYVINQVNKIVNE